MLRQPRSAAIRRTDVPIVLRIAAPLHVCVTHTRGESGSFGVMSMARLRCCMLFGLALCGGLTAFGGLPHWALAQKSETGREDLTGFRTVETAVTARISKTAVVAT